LSESPSEARCQWGNRIGTEDDKEDLKDVITAEMRKPGNCGLDEELAEAVDPEFYRNYKNWKQDNPTASTRQQVRHWVASWHAHLRDRATPGHLVNAITKKGLAEATQLRDQVIREFHLGTSEHL